MRDYRFFFLAGLWTGRKTTNFVSRETKSIRFVGIVSRETSAQQKAGATRLGGFTWNSRALPAQFCERIVTRLYNQG